MKILLKCCKSNPNLVLAPLMAGAVFILIYSEPRSNWMHILPGVVPLIVVWLVMVRNTIRAFRRTIRSLERRHGEVDERNEAFWKASTGGCYKAAHRAAGEIWAERNQRQ